MPFEKSKIAQFFMFVGLILLVVFFAAGQARSSAVGYFFAGLGLILLGGILHIRSRPPASPDSARFHTIRKYRERRAKRKEEREQRKKK